MDNEIKKRIVNLYLQGETWRKAAEEEAARDQISLEDHSYLEIARAASEGRLDMEAGRINFRRLCDPPSKAKCRSALRHIAEVLTGQTGTEITTEQVVAALEESFPPLPTE